MTESEENETKHRPRTTDADASAGWREECRHQHVDDAIATDGGERPEDCLCWDVDADLPCWPCAREGFDTQNPAEPAADEDTADAREHPERAPLSAFTDGGTTYTVPSTGDRVRDRDSDDGDELVVVEVHEDTTAARYWIDAIDASVASVNSAYGADAPVVEAAYVSDVEDALDGWRSVEDLRDAVSFGALSTYTFPADRLAALPGGGRR